MSSKKMFLVPPDVMDGLRRKQRLEEIDQPERKVQGDLDAQMNTLLQRNDIPDREKLVLYNQLLQQLLQQKTSTSLKSGSPLVTGPPLRHHLRMDYPQGQMRTGDKHVYQKNKL